VIAPVEFCPGYPLYRALSDLAALKKENERLREVLTAIAETGRWYADNDQRLPHEVDHALCVEILSMAESA
jgi:hypothetical protein